MSAAAHIPRIEPADLDEMATYLMPVGLAVRTDMNNRAKISAIATDAELETDLHLLMHAARSQGSEDDPQPEALGRFTKSMNDHYFLMNVLLEGAIEASGDTDGIADPEALMRDGPEALPFVVDAQQIVRGTGLDGDPLRNPRKRRAHG